MATSIIGIGGANIDLHSRSAAPLRLRDSNPGSVSLSHGGVCRNVCENLARLGESVSLITAVGDDAFGLALREGAHRVGLDMTYTRVCAGARTGTYLCVLDDAGDMLLAMNDMQLLDTALTPAFFVELQPVLCAPSVRVCVLDANLSPQALLAAASACTAPLFADPVSCAKAVRLVPILDKLHTIKPNRMELETLSGMPVPDDAALPAACATLLTKGVQRVVVSLGEHGMYYQDTHGVCVRRRSRPLRARNATGAGDAAVAGLVYAFLHEMDARQTLDFAIAASLAAIDCEHTINPALCAARVRDYSKEYVE